MVISTRNAIEGEDLGELKNRVEEIFIRTDEKEKDAQTALSKLEADFVRSFLNLETRSDKWIIRINQKIKQGFIKKIEKKEKRKLRAQEMKYQAVWFGMGSFGVIGWSVMIPTVIGIAVGIWADKKWPGHISWTLTFLFAGIILGCSMPGTG